VTRCVCEKNAQNVARPVFVEIKKNYTGKSSSKLLASSVMLKNCPSKNRLNSFNLVTLLKRWEIADTSIFQSEISTASA
jgi:hypothetical protein